MPRTRTEIALQKILYLQFRFTLKVSPSITLPSFTELKVAVGCGSAKRKQDKKDRNKKLIVILLSKKINIIIFYQFIKYFVEIILKTDKIIIFSSFSS